MFRNFELTFTAECSDFLQKIYSDAKYIVEYGSGGSTLLAAKLNKHIITVESCVEWLVELMGSYKENDYPGNIVPIWANIGKTGNWGYPIDQNAWKKWKEYSILPWRYCLEHEMDPDVVLIDGRFRVSCFISTCIYIKKKTLIIFDDFVDRKNYHVILGIAKPKKIIENRMAVFWVEPGMVNSQFLLDSLLDYFNPE